MAKPIPEGTHTVTPHLIVKGGADAIEFYKRAFGAVERGRMPGPGGLVMHAELQIGDSRIYLADEFQMGRSPKAFGGSPVTMHLYLEDVDAGFARAVGAGAKVTMPLMDMFWGDRYGMVEDPFGHSWSLATHKEDVTPEEMGKRMAAMAQAPAPAPAPKAASKAAPAPKPKAAPKASPKPAKKAPAKKAAKKKRR